MTASLEADTLLGWALLEKLGEGSFGKVFKARNEQSGQLAAVKIVPVEQDTGAVSKEIETLKQCSSPNVVQYFGSLTKDGELWIIMEFCPGSSLADIMEVPLAPLPWLTCGPAHSCTLCTGARPLPHRGADRRGDGGYARGPQLPA
jgi:serine/threonine protein kinase